MHSYNLSQFLSGHTFVFMILLCRIGSVMMLMPGIGETYVSPRVRLMFAFMLCLLLLEPMLPRMPTMPTDAAALGLLIIQEMVIGLFFGLLLRITIATLESAGAVIGLTTGLSNATLLSPALATQSTLPAAFLSTAGVTLIFVTGLDHFLIRSTIGLYDAFPVGNPLLPADMSQTIIHAATKSFSVGVELAAPFLIMSLLFYTALGLLQRLMPMLQLFMISLPVQIWGGLTIMSLTISGIMTLWLEYVDHSVSSMFQG